MRFSHASGFCRKSCAVAWARRVEGPLRRGALVRPIPQTSRSSQAHHVIVPRGRPLAIEAAQFREWLITTVAAEADPADDLPTVHGF